VAVVDTTTAWKVCTKKLTADRYHEGLGGKPPGPLCFWTLLAVQSQTLLSWRVLVIVEVESNENCEGSFFGRFKEVRPARPVSQVRLYDRNPTGEWYRITGWSDNEVTPECPAYAQLVEDSGAGLTHLVYGGIQGLRFKPITIEEGWDLGSLHQWGEAYLSLSSDRDLRYAD
jgi:hypothetical protein